MKRRLNAIFTKANIKIKHETKYQVNEGAGPGYGGKMLSMRSLSIFSSKTNDKKLKGRKINE